jgi:anaerobic magnesium-protoporphyrin IX monomethyl ester cyclase
MTSVLLIYPYFKPRHDRSVFRFPPLGLSYIAAYLQQAGHTVRLLDCTFLDRPEAMQLALQANAALAGIYCMVSMTDDCFWFARQLREHCRLLVAGGPLPTCGPEPFLEHFDVVVRGEGEQTMLELLGAFEDGAGLEAVPGIVFHSHGVLGASRARTSDVLQTSESWSRRNGEVPKQQYTYTAPRPFTQDLDNLPFPARELLPNQSYIQYGRQKYGYAITTVMSTRGCPYRCEFCSNVVFGGSYRERSPHNVIDEIEAALGFGYDRISFADDVFTMKRSRVVEICQEILRRGLRFEWECLGRADAMDYPTAMAMREAGCRRIFFGIESGDERILELMGKHITLEQARQAVEAAHRAGLEVGAFFILFYPGDTDETVLNTLRFATRLPLDYLGLSMPYPLPGTALYERIKQQINRSWRPEESLFGSHVLIYQADFSETKMWFGIIKGHIQFVLQHRLGNLGRLLLPAFEKLTDRLLKILK